MNGIDYIKRCIKWWNGTNQLEKFLLVVLFFFAIFLMYDYRKRTNDGFILPHKWQTYTQDNKLYRRCVCHDGIQNYMKHRHVWAVLVECDGSIPYSTIYTDSDNKLRFEILPNGERRYTDEVLNSVIRLLHNKDSQSPNR